MSKIVRLADIAILKTGPFGTQFKASEYVSEGIPVINVKNIGYGNIYYEGLEHIAESTCQRLSEHILRAGDIVFGRKGSVDRHCFITEREDGWFQGSDCLRVRITDNTVYPKYVSYYLLCGHVIRGINHAAVGSTMPSLNMDIISDIKIVLPSYEEQRKIADLLSSIDLKISSNNKINDNLQRQLKLMYDYWFTQFDFPDENGKPYRASGGVMLWNEQLKRNIPAGWTVDNLYAVADYINGLACQNYRPDDDNHKLPVIKITEMHNGITDSTESVRDDIPEKYIIEDGDILFSWSATLETMLWYGGRGGLNQHIFKVVPKCPKYFAYSQLSSYIINFKAIAEARKTTMGHITTDHMEQSRIAIPPTIVQETFNRQVTPLYEQFANNCKENLRLQALRDWLLPMLMNGQATIAD